AGEGPQAAGVGGAAAAPQRFSLSRRRILHGDPDPHGRYPARPRGPPSGRDHRRRLSRRSHQDRGGACARHAAGPLPAHHHRHRVRLRHRVWPHRPHCAHRHLHRRRSRRLLPMMAASFDFEAPDFFTTGTVGVPGRRTFYLQAREAGTVVTLKLEKEQIRALAEYLAKLLNDLPKPGALPRDMALLEPVSEAWVVGSLGVAYDESADRILIVAEELTEETEEDEDEEDDEPAEGTTVEESPRAAGASAETGEAAETPRS